MPLFIFDTETIPDRAAYARILHMPPSSSLTDVIQEWESAQRPFKAGLQQLVSLAAAWISDDGIIQRLDTLGSPDDYEISALRTFFDAIQTHHPVLAGWNTSGYDLPVLLTRALKHHIPVGDYYTYHAPYDGYTKRYSVKDHRDIMDLASFYRATAPLKLDEAAALLDIPGKLDTAGDQVTDLYTTGQLETIHAYCQHDVLTTAAVYAAMALHRGWWTAQVFATFTDSLTEFLEIHAGTHWDLWADAYHALHPVSLA